jgi:hypothetical protein
MLVTAAAGHGDGRWARGCGICFFNSFSTFFAESHLISRHTCAVGFSPGSRHRALCRPSGAECPLPRVPSRHSLCGEDLDLCREQHALGKAIESGSDLWRMFGGFVTEGAPVILKGRKSSFSSHRRTGHHASGCDQVVLRNSIIRRKCRIGRDQKISG